MRGTDRSLLLSRILRLSLPAFALRISAFGTDMAGIAKYLPGHPDRMFSKGALRLVSVRPFASGPGTRRAHRARRQGPTQTNAEPRRNVASRAHRPERGGRKAKDHGAVAARRQRHATAAAYLPLSFAPGDAYPSARDTHCGIDLTGGF
jgi:hypothetical protein